MCIKIAAEFQVERYLIHRLPLIPVPKTDLPTTERFNFLSERSPRFCITKNAGIPTWNFRLLPCVSRTLRQIQSTCVPVCSHIPPTTRILNSQTSIHRIRHKIPKAERYNSTPSIPFTSPDFPITIERGTRKAYKENPKKIPVPTPS